MSDVIQLVSGGYAPIPENIMEDADRIIADLRSGKLTGFILIAVGPETAGVHTKVRREPPWCRSVRVVTVPAGWGPRDSVLRRFQVADSPLPENFTA